MRWAPIALLMLTAPASAQTLVAQNQQERAVRDFQAHRGDTPFRCEVTPLPPVLNFAFRFQAGYTFHVPLSGSVAPARGWSVFTAITPQSGGPSTYLLAHTQLADATKSELYFDVSGVYLLGVGRYSVDAALRDGQNRICRKQWDVVVAPSRANRAASSALPPNTVRDISAQTAPNLRHMDNIPPVRLSVLLNAAAVSPRRTAMRPADRLVLLGALTAMLEHVPATSVRLVVFSLEQQREIFRDDNFTLARLDAVTQAIDALQLATVDVRVLQKPLGHIDLLTSLINRELTAPTPADRVIFLGPPSRYQNRLPANFVGLPPGVATRFFYVRYEGPRRPPVPANMPDPPRPPGGRGGGGASQQNTDSSDPTATPPPPRLPPPSSNSSGSSTGSADGTAGSSSRGGSPSTGMGGTGGRNGASRAGSSLPPFPVQMERLTDIITEAVARLKGKTLAIHSPGELARAIQRIERR